MTNGIKRLALTFAIGLGVSCATSPLGRKQLIFVSDSQMNQMGLQAFEELKGKEARDPNPANLHYVECLLQTMTQIAESKTAISQWEVVVFQNEMANAFALPGGKIGVYTGILDVAKTPSQLAAVLAHEIGHVIARHGAERVSQQAGTQAGLSALGLITQNNPHRNHLMSLLGVGAQVGVLLPFGRTQESEADLIGLDLMAQAGFDPNGSVELWRNMIENSGGKAPPQWLSTHPASENRINALQRRMPNAVKLYQASGKNPNCARP